MSTKKLEELAGQALSLHASVSAAAIEAESLLEEINEMLNGKGKDNGRTNESVRRQKDVDCGDCDGGAGRTTGP